MGGETMAVTVDREDWLSRLSKQCFEHGITECLLCTQDWLGGVASKE